MSTEAPMPSSRSERRKAGTLSSLRETLERQTDDIGPAESVLERALVQQTARRDATHVIIPLDLIDPDPNQPRTVDDTSEAFDEFVASIREHGVLSAIEVWLNDETGRYEIITGERRFRAAQRIGLKEIPARITELTDAERAIRQLVENLQREDMNPVEESFGFKRLQEEFGLTHAQIAAKVGKSRDYVTKLLSLPTKLTGEEVAELRKCATSHIPSKSLILEALRTDDVETRRQILFGRMTVSQARKTVKRPAGGRPTQPSKTIPVTVGEYSYTVTVRAKKRERLLAQEVIDALDAAILKLTEDVQDH